MLINLKTSGLDGDLGRVADFYVDVKRFSIQQVYVEQADKHLLLPGDKLDQPDLTSKREVLPVNLTGMQAEALLPNRKPDLKSLRLLQDAEVRSTDDQVGRLDDFIIDTDGWMLSSIVVDTTGTAVMPARKTQVSPGFIAGISVSDRSIELNQTTRNFQKNPDFDPTAPVNRRNGDVLFDYYGRENQLI
jgi:hypothetical protein